MNFLSNENITLLWKIISQTNKVSREQLITSMNDFYKQSNSLKSLNSLNKDQLINMNKSYISYFKELNKKVNNGNMYTNVDPYTNSNTYNNDLFVPITFEEIQNKKREQFNDELTKKQKEFSSFNQVSIPPPLKFNEDLDKPIGEMEELIAKTIAERTLDIEKIHKNINENVNKKIKIDKSNLNLEEKHISWKEDLPLDDYSIKEKMSQIEKKLNVIIDLLNNNKN